MMRWFIAFLALTTAAHADPAMTNIVDLSGSTAMLQPTERPGAIAELTFDNRAVNGPQDIRGYRLQLDLALGVLTVPFNFEWEVPGTNGDDAVVAHPPEGVTCLPTSCRLQIREYDIGTMWLFDTSGVGM